jgi:hypothetical protein
MSTNTLQIPSYEDFVQQAEWWVTEDSTIHISYNQKAGDYLNQFPEEKQYLSCTGESFLCLLIAEMIKTGDFE